MHCHTLVTLLSLSSLAFSLPNPEPTQMNVPAEPKPAPLNPPAAPVITNLPAPLPSTGPVSDSDPIYALGRWCVKDSPLDKGISFPRSKALSAINSFCKDHRPDPLAGMCSEATKDGIYISAHLGNAAETGNGNCPSSAGDTSDDSFENWENRCKFALRAAVDNCEWTSVEKKYGGWNSVGCMRFRISGVPDGYAMEECPK